MTTPHSGASLESPPSGPRTAAATGGARAFAPGARPSPGGAPAQRTIAGNAPAPSPGDEHAVPHRRLRGLLPCRLHRELAVAPPLPGVAGDADCLPPLLFRRGGRALCVLILWG